MTAAGRAPVRQTQLQHYDNVHRQPWQPQGHDEHAQTEEQEHTVRGFPRLQGWSVFSLHFLLCYVSPSFIPNFWILEVENALHSSVHSLLSWWCWCSVHFAQNSCLGLVWCNAFRLSFMECFSHHGNQWSLHYFIYLLSSLRGRILHIINLNETLLSFLLYWWSSYP